MKRNSPNLTLVTSYGYDSVAFAKIDNTVRVNGFQNLKHYMSIFKIISQTVRNVKYENRNNQEIEAVKEVNTSSSWNVLDPAETKGKGLQVGCQKGISANVVANQALEDEEIHWHSFS